MPPTFDAMTGREAAIAERIEDDSPSDKLGSTKQSKELR